jgi:uncharacterized protein (TIGR02996 family)
MLQDHDYLQAILENPEDDDFRLIFADWLEEQGDPRGEFIRTQCELATMTSNDARPAFADWLFSDWNFDLARFVGTSPAESERQSDLMDREQQLLDRHEETWTRPLREAVRACPMSPGELRDFDNRPAVGSPWELPPRVPTDPYLPN